MKNKVQLITYADRLGDGTLSSMTDILRTRFDEEAFRAAHTLKGVCLNLGFDELYEVSAEITE